MYSGIKPNRLPEFGDRLVQLPFHFQDKRQFPATERVLRVQPKGLSLSVNRLVQPPLVPQRDPKLELRAALRGRNAGRRGEVSQSFVPLKF